MKVLIKGHVGYYCAGMNQKAHVTIDGNVGTGVAENMMSGIVHVKGNASQSAGATAHGGLLLIAVVLIYFFIKIYTSNTP